MIRIETFPQTSAAHDDSRAQWPPTGQTPHMEADAPVNDLAAEDLAPESPVILSPPPVPWPRIFPSL